MNIAWFRDLVLCILGLGATLVVIFIAVLAFLFYKRCKPILDSLEATTKSVENLTSAVESKVAGPLAQIGAVIQGINQAIGLIKIFTQRKKEDDNE